MKLNRLIAHLHSASAKEGVPNTSQRATNATDHTTKMSLFLMSDLVRRRLQKTFVTELPSRGVRVMTSDNLADVPQDVGRLLRLSELGLHGNRVPSLLTSALHHSTASKMCDSKNLLNVWMQQVRGSEMATVEFKNVRALEDLLLFFEQAVCCFNTLGLISTQRSTVSGLIQATKAGGHCHTDLTCLKIGS